MNKKNVVMLALLSINWVSLQAEKFAVSVFYQPIPIDSSFQYMFSNTNPATMSSTFGKVTKATGTKIIEEDNNFNQYVSGAYFGISGAPSFYFTGKTTVPNTKYETPQVQLSAKASTKYNLNIWQVRMAALGFIDGPIDNNSSVTPASFKELAYLVNAVHNKSKLVVFTATKHCQLNCRGCCGSSWYSSNLQDKKHNKNYGCDSTDLMPAMVPVLNKTFQNKNIPNITTLSSSSFDTIPGVNMVAGTYFGDTIVVKLHLITPGLQDSITKKTKVSEVVNRQNPYTQYYPIEGHTWVGDTFGF
jgi:hypothetical protein